jgi:GT2 family glycosyltransferase
MSQAGVIADLTVVIPTIGRPVLAQCLEALAGGSALPARVVVVDQSGSESTRRLVDEARRRGLPTVYVSSNGRGPGAGRNEGVRHCTTPFIAAVDDDCCVATDWAERMRARLGVRPDAVITGTVEASDDHAAPSVRLSDREEVHDRPLRARDPLFTGNMGVARHVFDAVGPFDEHRALLPAAEDNDWAYRALQAGHVIIYAPEVRVRHLEWRSQTQLRETQRRYARGQGGFYGRHLRRGDLFIATRLLRDLGWGLWVLARGLAQRTPEMVMAGWIQLTELPRGVAAGLHAH